jgi:UDP-glucose-4-epimerase GalE
MKILVTGGAGYIGSHACKALARSGFTPITYDNLCRGNRWAAKWGPLEEGDISDESRLREVLELHEPAAVMHFAGYGYVGESVEKPLLYYQNNIGGSTSLLHSIIDWRPIPVVFSSTCAIYGLPEQIPIAEDHPQRPINPYGHTKLVVERMLADIGRAHQLRSMSLRYFNAAGADPEGEIGEARDPELHLIPRVLAAAREGGVVRVYGDNYDTPDGTCVRDYIHVTDLADAHVSALKYLLSGGPSCALNLANTCGYSVFEVIKLAERVSGRRIRTETAPARPGDPPVLIGAADRARELLNWTPRRAVLDVQIQDAWNWMELVSGKRCAKGGAQRWQWKSKVGSDQFD